ncbi:MAG TPA: nucleotide sugar dehydrogenase [Methylomirabilota bacterium]|nr:nucleotide sugar dehydrogenase [Methylomirabilota bacterium]
MSHSTVTLTQAKYKEALEEHFLTRQARIAVVGLGYVGLSLAVEFARAGFVVNGIDVDIERVSAVNAGLSYLVDVDSDFLLMLVRGRHLSATTAFESSKDADAVIICVPTPLRKSREPDISFVLQATESLTPHLRRGQLVVLESTTFPGTTEEILQPRLESLGFKLGHDFFLAFSPERVDPGNPQYKTRDIPKIVGGVTPACTALAASLYRQAITRVHAVSSPKVAETAKLLENTFRSVNIALANEVAIICQRLGINTWEVIEAAATKPFGFLPFYPGPGIGGHCIPIDPLYLSWKVRLSGYESKFISLADGINRAMPEHVVHLVTDALNQRSKSLRGSKILVLGVTYKRGVNDIRESPAIEIMHSLLGKGAELSYADPYVAQLNIDSLKLVGVVVSKETLREADCVLILTDHAEVDYEAVGRWAPLIVDTRNAMKHALNRDHIVTL